MKKLMIVTVLLSLVMSMSAQSAFTVQGGYSWSIGMIGAAYQMNHIEFGGGIMPSTMPGSGDPITSLSAYAALTSYLPYESGFYLSGAIASKAYRQEISYNGGTYQNGITAPMFIGNLGYKWQVWTGLNLKAELGYAMGKYSKAWTWGLIVGWTFL